MKSILRKEPFTAKLLFAAILFLIDALVNHGCGQPASAVIKEYDRLSALPWVTEFKDPCTGNWTDHWTLDGKNAQLRNNERGMDFHAGPRRKDDTSHAVLWTKQSFSGDIRIDYEYTKLDPQIEAVTILYIQATGAGTPGFDEDISKWAKKRTIARMATYFNNMNLIHISYAAFNIGNKNPRADYIRARRYIPEASAGLRNTEFKPDYRRTGMFQQSIPHKVTVIKTAGDLFMHIRNVEDELLCHWHTDSLPQVQHGPIGLRHMWTRAARYRDFRISSPAEQE